MDKSQRKRYLLQSFKEFCSQTSIAGYNNIFGDNDTPLIEKCLWLFINLFVLIISLLVLGSSWGKFDETPTVTTLDNQSYAVNSLYFPAVAICNINQMSRKRTYAYAELLAKRQFGHKASQADIQMYFDNLRNMGQLLVYNRDVTRDMENFQAELDILDPDPVTGFWDVEKAMKFMAPSCEDHIFNVKYNGEAYKTSETFFLQPTDEGFCCLFNYLRPPDTVYNDTFYPDVRSFPVKVGKSEGLEFILVNNISDYYFPTLNILGFQIMIFNPFEFPEAITGNYRRDILEMGDTSFFEVTPIVTKANREIKRYSKQKRGCLFREENFKEFDGNYKFAECLIKCRMVSIKALCECLPYFVPKNYKSVATNDTLTCSLHHLECLYKYRLKFRSWCPLLMDDGVVGLEREFIDGIFCPNCLPDCSYARYTFTSSFVALRNFPQDFNLKNTTDPRQSTIVKVFFVKHHTNLYWIDVVYSWEEMLSVFGSILSVFFGFSIISLLEVFYFGLWRTFQNYRNLINHETPVKVDVTNYKSIEQELLRISERKHLYPLPKQYQFLREIQPRKSTNRINY